MVVVADDEREDDERSHSVTDSSGMTYGKGDIHPPRGSKVRDDGIQPRRFPRKLFHAIVTACRRQLRERSPTGCKCFRLGQYYCIGGGGGGGGGGRLPSINFISE